MNVTETAHQSVRLNCKEALLVEWVVKEVSLGMSICSGCEMQLDDARMV